MIENEKIENENENAKTAKLVTQRWTVDGYLGRSSTCLRQQVWYSLVVGKTKTKAKNKSKRKSHWYSTKD